MALLSDGDEKTGSTKGGARGVLLLVLGFVVLFGILYVARLYSYDLFHSFAELFSVTVAFAVFAIAWNSRAFARSQLLLFLGIALVLVAFNDTLHLLSYKGMGVFPGADSDLPTQLWLTGRYQFTAALVVLPFLVSQRPWRFKLAVGGSVVLCAGLLLSIFAWPVFPAAFVDGQGLTAFKKISEYVVSGLLLVALALLVRRRSAFDRNLLLLLCGAIVVTVVSELSFTLYVDPYGIFNLVGHYLKIVAFFLLYKAMVQRSLERPYSLLFRGLRQREEALSRSEREFRSAFEQAAVGMLRVAPDGTLLLANRRLAGLLGYDAAELQAMPLARIVDAGQLRSPGDLVDDLVEGRTRMEKRELRLRRKDGTPVWTRLTRSLVSDQTGAPEYAVFVIEDITDQKRIEREREEVLGRLNGVGELTEVAMQSLDLDELMNSMLERVASLMKAQAATIMLGRGDTLVAIAGYGLSDDVAEHFSLSMGEGVAGLIATTGEPVYVDDVPNDPRVVNPLLRAKGIQASLGVPLKKGEDLLGVLRVDWTTRKDVSESDVRFLEMLADRAALAVFNADLYQRQKELAEALQQEMLVLPDALSGIRFGHAYRSASQGAHVGGDFYDLFSAGDSRAWLLMGDVSGHGIEAATTASLIREITRAYVFESGRPDEILDRLNRTMVRRLAFRQFATVFLGTLDTGTGELLYCSAGHPPAYLVGSDSAVTELTTRNCPIGAFRDSRYRSASARLRAGERLTLYTDGVIEARRDGEFFGETRLVELLQLHRSPEQVPFEVLRTVEEFSGGRLADDLAVLCACLS